MSRRPGGNAVERGDVPLCANARPLCMHTCEFATLVTQTFSTRLRDNAARANKFLIGLIGNTNQASANT
jgi:hypothetical protein